MKSQACASKIMCKFIVWILVWAANIKLLIYFDMKLWNQISLSLSIADDLKHMLEFLLIDWNQNSSEIDIIEMQFAQLLNLDQDIYLSQETFDILRGLSIFLGIYSYHSFLWKDVANINCQRRTQDFF